MTKIRKLWNDHPNLVSWLVLAVGMVIIVVIAVSLMPMVISWLLNRRKKSPTSPTLAM